MEKLDDSVRFVNSAKLADVFGVSERQIQRLVRAGVIDTCNSEEKPYRFDLTVVIPQYISFLTSRIPISEWAPDT